MKFIAEDEGLTIKLQGWEAVWGLRRQIVIPRNQITNLSWFGDYVYDGSLLRVFGAGLPGWFYAGNFKDIGSGQLVYLYLAGRQGFALNRGGVGGKNVLEITLHGGKFAKVIVGCRPSIGRQLVDWWAN